MPDAAAKTYCAARFFASRQRARERRTWWVVGLTGFMMAGEIVGGIVYGSMALLADGWHMATHAAALTIAALAYRYAREHSDDPRFSFGTGKVGELAGFGSAVSLGVVSLLIAWESLQRLLSPEPIDFAQATALAALGLAVNLASAWLLRAGDHDPHHDHEHRHADAGATEDSNFRAAYLHVLADALTSLMAIAGLLAARYLGWLWLDPVIGIVGAVVIAQWSVGLMRTAARALLDASGNQSLLATVTERLASADTAIVDLHLWRVGPGHHVLIVALETTAPRTPDDYKARLAGLSGLSHVTIEVNARPTRSPRSAAAR